MIENKTVSIETFLSVDHESDIRPAVAGTEVFPQMRTA
jgi:hypothetical protein